MSTYLLHKSDIIYLYYFLWTFKLPLPLIVNNLQNIYKIKHFNKNISSFSIHSEFLNINISLHWTQMLLYKLLSLITLAIEFDYIIVKFDKEDPSL